MEGKPQKKSYTEAFLRGEPTSPLSGRARAGCISWWCGIHRADAVGDLFLRRVVGWSLQPTREKRLVTEALERALSQRQPPEGLLCHSDSCGAGTASGSPYASADYQALLKREKARADIFCWIEVWYNRRRRHSALGYLSLEESAQRAAMAAVRSLPIAA